MESKNQLLNKIADYFLGEGNKESLRNSLESTSESKEFFQWANSFWNVMKPEINHTQRIKELTKQKIDVKPQSIASFHFGVIKYAAVILLALMVGGTVYFYSKKDVEFIEVASGVGQMEEVELPDGSKAWLNAQSKLIYPSTFDGNYREVNMTGEVYFEIETDTRHPFIVSSDYVKIKVKGTSFLVSSYANEPVVKTYLKGGSVELEITESGKILKMIPGDDVTYIKEQKKVTWENKPGANIDSWRYGDISFYNESFFEIARKLERKFGVEIIFPEQELGNMKLTAEFETEGLEEIIGILCELSGVNLKRNGNQIIISKNEMPM